jgi:hypothetical protein
MAFASNVFAQRESSTDIEGVWNFNTMTPLQRPAGVSEPTFTHDEAAECERTFFERGPEGAPAPNKQIQIDFKAHVKSLSSATRMNHWRQRSTVANSACAVRRNARTARQKMWDRKRGIETTNRLHN